jgi:NADH-quinone oxidoreductase subunit M
VPATFGVVLAAAYLLWATRRLLFGPVERPENRSLIDLDLREKLVMVALLVPIFWLGLYPETALARIRPAVIDVLHTMEARSARVADAGGAASEVRLRLAAALPAEARR